MRPEDRLADRYRLIYCLGAGSGGRVFKAEQVNTGQIVALKLLQVNALDGEARDRRLERFRREIAFCSQLYHPEIVRLLDSGELPDDVHFAVFEFIPGITLGQLLAEEGALKVRRARNLMIQLLPPLSYAHRKGIFHRDLKPSNVMVTRDGARDRLKILDLGIGIATGWQQPGNDRLTLSHEWVGTPAYAAPEQLRGEPIGAGSDLYAWALMFLECLTGSSAVAGKSLPEIVRQQLSPEEISLPPALREHPLGRLLSRVLEKNPARRPSDADDILSLLDTLSVAELEDGQGYLHDSVPELRPPRVVVSDTVTDQPRRAHIEPRRATVVCCQLLPAESDEEVEPERIDPLFEQTNLMVREVMAQFGATVVDSSGPFTLSYFGLSRARDEDARLALKAAREVLDRVGGMRAFAHQKVMLRAQIGIHNGPVMVQLRDGSRHHLDGLTATIAMRLALLADGDVPQETEGQIVVSDDFRQVIARQVKLEIGGASLALRVPWSRGPLFAYRVQAGALLASPQIREASAFVGRVTELDTLQAAWKRRETQGGSAVVIQGEPGVGKSRLVLELMRRPPEEPVEWVDVRCLPEWQNGFLRPLAILCLRTLGLEGKSPADAGAALDGALERLGVTAAEAIPLLCTWLALPMPEGHAPLPWSPQKQRSRLHQVVADLLIARMQGGAAMLIEDLHWADPSTLECIDGLLHRAAGRPFFLVMTTRSTARQAFSAPVQTLKLERLPTADARSLAGALMPADSSNDAHIARIAARSDGIPLYLEELALAFRERLVPSGDIRQTRDLLLSPDSVPPSLHDLLASRLDEVAEAKPIAQLAATVGREFSLDMLAKIQQRDAVSLLGDIEQLVTAEIVVRLGPSRSGSYGFRHALIRDAAYDSMSASAQQRAHLHVAQGLVDHFPQMAEAEPDILAYHWERAGQTVNAVAAWQRAATKSSMASAHLEALAQLDRALALMPEFSPPEARGVREAELLLAKGAILIAKWGYTDPRAATSFQRAAGLVPRGGETAALAFGARWGLWHLRVTEANLTQAQELAGELAEIARTSDDPSFELSAFEADCQTSFCRSSFAACVEAGQRCAAKYDFDRHRHLCTVRGDDPLLASLSFQSFAELLQGKWAQSMETVDRGLDLAARLGYPAMSAAMRSQAAWARLVWGGSGARAPKVSEAREHALATFTVGDEHGFPFWTVYGRGLDAAARIVAGDLTAIDQLQQGIGIRKAVGAVLGRCFLLTFLGQALRRAGQYEQADAVLREALEFCEEHDSRYYEPEVRRERAELLGAADNPRRDLAAALEECQLALARSAAIGAKWWSLATLLTQARFGDATHRDELRRLVEEFPPDPGEPPILGEARGLVRVVSSEQGALLVRAQVGLGQQGLPSVPDQLEVQKRPERH